MRKFNSVTVISETANEIVATADLAVSDADVLSIVIAQAIWTSDIPPTLIAGQLKTHARHKLRIEACEESGPVSFSNLTLEAVDVVGQRKSGPIRDIFRLAFNVPHRLA